MDADQPEDMTQAAVDHELRALLAVDPSPEFVARMRTRIADEPRASWWSPRLVAAVAAAAAVIVGIVLTKTRPEAPRSAEVLALGRSAPIVHGVEPSHAAPLVAVHVATRPGSPKPPRHTPVEAEIVIDAREVSAIRALMRGVDDGRLDLKPVLAATTPSVMELSPIDNVAIAPLIIPPLEEGARQ